MAMCTSCSENPFDSMFAKEGGQGRRRADGAAGAPVSDADAAKQAANLTKIQSTPWVQRSAAEVETVVATWEEYVHERAYRAMQTNPGMVKELLRQLAQNTDKNGPDPVLEKGMFYNSCVHWHGQYSDDGHPIVHLKRGDDTQPTYVNRIMALLFASDEQFAALSAMSKESFPMSCSNNTCVQFKHISAGK